MSKPHSIAAWLAFYVDTENDEAGLNAALTSIGFSAIRAGLGNDEVDAILSRYQKSANL